MNKFSVSSILFIALIALFALAPVHAQNSVSVYGRINTVMEHQKISGQSSTQKMLGDGTFIGFRGQEDLGNGLRASFALEQDVDSTNGAANEGFESKTELSLAGSFGTIKAGNYDPSSFTVTADAISLQNENIGSSQDYLFSKIAPKSSKFGYITPEVHGFQAQIGYAFKDNHEVNGKKKAPYDFSLTYAYGNLNLAFGFDKFDKAQAFTLGGLYASGPWTLGSYIQYDDEGFSDNYSTKTLGHRTTVRMVGQYAFGASEIVLNVGWADHYSKVQNSSASQYTLAYNYHLSKRTKVYTLYTGIDQDKNGFYGTAAGKDSNSVSFGIRHLF